MKGASPAQSNGSARNPNKIKLSWNRQDLKVCKAHDLHVSCARKNNGKHAKRTVAYGR